MVAENTVCWYRLNIFLLFALKPSHLFRFSGLIQARTREDREKKKRKKREQDEKDNKKGFFFFRLSNLPYQLFRSIE